MGLPSSSPNIAKKATIRKTKHSNYASQGNSRVRTKQRRARFNNTVTVTEIPSHRVYSFDERFAVWYSQSEYRCFSLQESIRKMNTKNTNNITELSDRVRNRRDRVPKALRANRLKRKFKSENIIGGTPKSANMSNELHEAVSLVVQARNATNRRLAQIQWQLQQNQRLSNSTPLWASNAPLPNLAIPTPAMQTKQGTMLSALSQMPFDFSSNKVPFQGGSTPMTDPNSPVARGA